MKNRLISLLRWSEQYTKTDMVYIASGTFWGYLNTVIVAAFGFVTSIFFAKYLTKDAFGTYQYILSIASLVGSTTLTGMNVAVTRAAARGYEGELRPAVKYQLIAGIIPTIIGLIVATWYFVNSNQQLGSAFLWIAILLPLSSAFNTWVAYMGGKKLFRVGTYYGLSQNVFSSVVILLTIYFAQNYLWVVFVNFFLSFVTSFILYNITLKQFPPNDKRDGETISFGSHLSFMGILGVFAAQLDTLLIFHFIGSAALAVYSFATILPEKLTGMLKIIPNLAMPKLANLDEAGVRSVLKKRLWVLVVLLTLMTIVYAAMAPWIFHTFFPAYTDSILFTQVYSLAFFSLVASILQTALTSQRKTKELYILSVLMPIFRAATMCVLMFYYGIWGLLSSQIISNFVSIIIQSVLVFSKKPIIQNS